MVISKKICLIGDFAVGKTSLIRRYVEREFEDRYLSTVGTKMSVKRMQLPAAVGAAPVDLKLIIWDIEGSTKFDAIAPSHLQGAGGAIVVGSLDREETLAHLKDHVQTFLAINTQRPVIIALNKADLLSPQHQETLLQQTRAAVTSGTLGYQLTSAKTGNGVDRLFETLAYAL